MAYKLEAACGCSIGRVRKNNEDNLFFGGQCLQAENTGLKKIHTLRRGLRKPQAFAVFDGMGGERFGELASFAATDSMQAELGSGFTPEEDSLTELCQTINNAVVAQKRELKTEHMGSTMAALFFDGEEAYACNLGDSRVYLVRDGELRQLSVDHVSQRKSRSGKAPLTQHLGIDPEELLLEPHILRLEIQPDDRFLICSDGVTDMLSDEEIFRMVDEADTVKDAVRDLMDAAMENGGRDNTTAIVCQII